MHPEDLFLDKTSDDVLSATPSSRIDINAFIRGEDKYWLMSGTDNEQQKKKIILTDVFINRENVK